MSEKTIWAFLVDKLGNEYGAAGLMGNLYAESGLISTNLQNSYQNKLGFTDATYTAAVDKGTYTNFEKDGAGYGLAQWTYWSRKRDLLNYAKRTARSIGDETMQLEFLMDELGRLFSGVLFTLRTADSVKEASDAVLTQFERPADMSEANKARRAAIGQAYYEKYATKKGVVDVDVPVLKKGAKGDSVKALQVLLIGYGFPVGKTGADGSFGGATHTAVRNYQKANGLTVDGSVGAKTWDKLING